jgi:hypothetical protein
MKFTVERIALVKMLEVIGRKAPAKKWRDKEVRLSACAARVFVEANESVAGIEALVFEDGTCFLEHKAFLKLLKTYFPKKNITVEANERNIQLGGSTRPVSGYSRTVTPPGKFQVFNVTDEWLSESRSKAVQIEETKTIAKLPNAEKLIIEREKILDYLLNSEHRIGAAKASFFSKFGFCVEKWKVLADALRIHGQTNGVRKIHETDFGPRYEVEGKLNTPDGRTPLVRSVWQLDKGAVAPRLITAYPLEAR